jgi:Protein of unknown function (DUF2958)
MRLLTEEIRKSLPPLYATEEIPLAQKVIRVKFFDPCSEWTWYAIEGQPTEDGDFLCWGLVRGHCEEWGYFLLSELKGWRGRLGIGIERDLFFEPGTVQAHAEREGMEIDMEDVAAVSA